MSKTKCSRSISHRLWLWNWWNCVCGVFGLYTQMVLIQTLFYTIFTWILWCHYFVLTNFLTLVCEWYQPVKCQYCVVRSNAFGYPKIDHTKNKWWKSKSANQCEKKSRNKNVCAQIVWQNNFRRITKSNSLYSLEYYDKDWIGVNTTREIERVENVGNHWL